MHLKIGKERAMKLFTIAVILIMAIFSGCQKSSNDYYSEGLKEIKKKEFKEALASFSKAIELDSTNIDAYLERGRYGAYSSSYNQEADLSKYIETISPKLANSFIGRGMINTIKEDYSTALRDFEKAQSLEPANVQACGLKIQMLIKLEQKALAKAFIESLPENIKSEIKKMNYTVDL